MFIVVESMEERFLKHVNKTETCWLWTASIRNGYGQFRIDGKTCRVNRVAYELWVGEIPDRMLVRHKCNVPTCVNPEHLEVGTHQDNMNDKVRAGRQHFPKGEKNGRAILTKEKVLDILSRKGQTLRELADEFGVSQRQISNILRGESW